MLELTSGRVVRYRVKINFFHIDLQLTQLSRF